MTMLDKWILLHRIVLRFCFCVACMGFVCKFVGGAEAREITVMLNSFARSSVEFAQIRDSRSAFCILMVSIHASC